MLKGLCRVWREKGAYVYVRGTDVHGDTAEGGAVEELKVPGDELPAREVLVVARDVEAARDVEGGQVKAREAEGRCGGID